MNYAIISDVHLGSKKLNTERVARFLNSLPEDYTLILNGDIVNQKTVRLKKEHASVLRQIATISLQTPVHWVRGNHDRLFNLQETHNVNFHDFDAVFEPGICVLHGHDFRNNTQHNVTAILLFRLLYTIKRNFASEPIQGLKFMNRMTILQRFLQRHVKKNAMQHALEHKCKVVICGHTHEAEECESQGIKYFNTGSWLDETAFFLEITKNKTSLQKFS